MRHRRTIHYLPNLLGIIHLKQTQFMGFRVPRWSRKNKGRAGDLFNGLIQCFCGTPGTGRSHPVACLIQQIRVQVILAPCKQALRSVEIREATLETMTRYSHDNSLLHSPGPPHHIDAPERRVSQHKIRTDSLHNPLYFEGLNHVFFDKAFAYCQYRSAPFVKGTRNHASYLACVSNPLDRTAIACIVFSDLLLKVHQRLNIQSI